MRLTERWTLVALIASLTAGANAQIPAAPASAAEPKPSVLEQARDLRKQGMALQNRGEFEGARNLYLSAWKLEPRPEVMANLAIVETQLKRFRDASEHCAIALRELPKDSQADDLRSFKADCDTATSRIGTITIAVNHPGAEVFVNGKSAGSSPLVDPVFVDPGLAIFEARVGDRRTERYEIDVAAGSALRIKLAVPDAQPATTPGPRAPSSPVIPPGATADDRSRPSVLGPALLGGGLVVTGLALGLAFGAKSASAEDDAKRLASSLSGQNTCSGGPAAYGQTCQSIGSANDDRKTYRMVSTAGYVGAGVVAAGTIAYLLIARPKSSHLALTPAIAPTQAHLVLESTF